MGEGQAKAAPNEPADRSVEASPVHEEAVHVRRTTHDLLSYWKVEADTRAIAQQITAVSEAKANRTLGIAVTVLATIGGTSLFASLLTSDDETVVLAAGVFTVIAAVLSAVQTSLALGESSGSHRSASAGFFGLKERIEIAIAFLERGDEVSRQQLEDFAKDAEQLEKGTKPVSEKVYDEAKARAKKAPVL